MILRRIEEFCKYLTTGQVKKLSGLDNTTEIMGCKSFQNLRVLTERYLKDIVQSKDLMKGIDKTEIFHKHDLTIHLTGDSDCFRSCLICLFSSFPKYML